MRKENLELEKKLNIGAIVVSIVVLALVLLMRRVKFDLGVDFSFLPPFHAFLNGLTACVLLVALYFVKQKNYIAHEKTMKLAIGLSVLFLLSYVTYHFTTEETRFCKEGTIRIVYFILLISHIILAAVILPFILFTFIRAFTGQNERHRKMAKWVFPIWFYVAISGPICYFMLKDCYQ